MNKAVLFIVCLFALAIVLSNYLKPEIYIYKQKEEIKLDALIPNVIGEWKAAKSQYAPIRAADEVAKLDAIYSDMLERTYIDNKGIQVMLSVAYGADQSNDTTQVHRPEYCYPAQGFSMEHLGDEVVSLNDKNLNVRRLKAVNGSRTEYITYWIVLGHKAILPGLNRKLLQIEYGLKGYIPDGMLVRVSTVGDSEKDFAIHNDFITQMVMSIEPEYRQSLRGQ